ncbi:MAG: hypothetical protein LBV67_07380 [Streptococcaceae bacterium]|jgi:hypothetical protein|nr:hypothetical protein [Streptococcaceae bacterium]
MRTSKKFVVWYDDQATWHNHLRFVTDCEKKAEKCFKKLVKQYPQKQFCYGSLEEFVIRGQIA